MSIASDLRREGAKLSRRRKKPLWRGPEVDGVTCSLLSRFLVCRERFRLLVVEGLKPADQFNHKMEYGNMWHVCEEALARKGDWSYSNMWHVAGKGDWSNSLQMYASILCKRYPLSQDQVEHWYNVCKTQFPLYVDYWAKHPDVISRTPIFQEQVFEVPYSLPSGRVVRLRGKWDSVDLIGGQGIYLQENKSKGQINEGQIQTQLKFDLQTMTYLVALEQDQQSSNGGSFGNTPIRGVRYNVVRRPLSGGKGTIVRHKPSKSNPDGETKEAFYGRLAQYIKDEPGTYFMRWTVEVSPADLDRFRRDCLHPILEQLCLWWDWVGRPFVKGQTSDTEEETGIHWRHPYGVYNVLNEGGSSDLDEYLATGSRVGLQDADTLFPELE